MGQFVAGDVVVVAFPFSDLSAHKVRPALVLAAAEFDNLILCQITSKPQASKRAVRIDQRSFESGRLPVVSYVRPDKIFTADPVIIQRTAGKLDEQAFAQVMQLVRSLF